jgi:serine/threonine protein kinase
LEFYRIGKVLGKGAFGKVNLGMQKFSRKLVAIKSMNRQILNEESSKRSHYSQKIQTSKCSQTVGNF